jgi:hypothetical protein
MLIGLVDEVISNPVIMVISIRVWSHRPLVEQKGIDGVGPEIGGGGHQRFIFG